MSSQPPFQPFGEDHLAVVGMTLAVGLLLVIGKTHWRGQIDRSIRILLGLGLLVGGGSGWSVAWLQGQMVVPLQLCDLALVAAVWALFTLQHWACLLVWFWGLAASLQALITPDLRIAFPGFWWFQFFGTHAGIVLAAVYLAATGRVRPTFRATALVWLVTNAYAGIAVAVNQFYGTNFGYLAAKPAHPSVLDWFGPWPWYLLAIEAIGTLSLLLLYLPFALFHRSR